MLPNHKEILKVLGDEKRLFNYEVSGQYVGISEQTIKELADSVARILPQYTHDVRLSTAAFANPYLPSGESLTKNIKKYANRMGYDVGVMEKLDRVLSVMGQTWDKASIKPMTISGILSFEEDAFENLGHYGCDNNSCFADGHENTNHKFTLSECNNSYVVLLKTGDHDNMDIRRGKNDARMWGFYNPEDNVFNFCNLYTKHINAITIAAILREFVASIMEVDPASVDVAMDKIRAHANVYINLKTTQRQETFSFFNLKEHKTIGNQYLTDSNLSPEQQRRYEDYYAPVDVLA